MTAGFNGVRVMKSFEVGKTYKANNRFVSPVKVLKRMPKTLEVTDGFMTWRMRINHDEKGNEVVVNKFTARGFRYSFTYSAEWEVNI